MFLVDLRVETSITQELTFELIKGRKGGLRNNLLHETKVLRWEFVQKEVTWSSSDLGGPVVANSAINRW